MIALITCNNTMANKPNSIILIIVCILFKNPTMALKLSAPEKSTKLLNKWKSRKIAKTVVYGRVPAGSLKQYRLDFYSGSYVSGSEISSVTSNYSGSGVGNATPDTLIFPPVECQTIRLTTIVGSYLQMAEFQAFSGDFAEPFKIGAYDIPNSGSINRILSGAIGEVLIYEGSLTDFERKHVEEYLYDKWEIVTSASY